MAPTWCAYRNEQSEKRKPMKIRTPILALLIALSATVTSVAFAQTASTAPAASAPQPWIYKTKQLNRAEIDALLAKPGDLVVIDVRRPDELTAKGSFPVYLNIQVSELEKGLDYIPKDRAIVTVSNRAHRAGAAGDLLTAKGFKVAGAAGSQDYEDQGGKITRIAVPPPRQATAAPTFQAAK
jgi:rhodanese-related sulfurtransferase